MSLGLLAPWYPGWSGHVTAQSSRAQENSAARSLRPAYHLKTQPPEPERAPKLKQQFRFLGGKTNFPLKVIHFS